MKRMNVVFTLCLLGVGALAFAPKAAAEELLTNGDFETGTLSGWTTDDQQDLTGTGGFFIGSPGANTPGPDAEATASNPLGGKFYAVTAQSAPGAHILYQAFTITADSGPTTVTYQMFANSTGALSTPATLSPHQTDNQQARVDIVNSVDVPFSVDSSVVVDNLYDGIDTGTNPNPYKSYSFDISALDQKPRTYYIRFAEVDNEGLLNLGVDNVSITSAGTGGSVIVPEPSTWAMLLGGLAALVWWRSRSANAQGNSRI